MANPLESLRVFCTAAESVNFRDAAVRLGVSPQVVTRVVRTLEDQLGEPLFHRSTRGVQLTRFGEQLAERARGAVAGVDALFPERPRQAASALGGTVRVAAPGVIGRPFLVSALAPLLLAQPEIQLDLRLSEVLADVVDQQIDVGVRIGFLRDSRFVVRPAGRVAFWVVAAPALLARLGRPGQIADLNQWPTTMLIDRNTGRPWPWMFRGGRQLAPATPAFVTDDTDAEFEAVVAGLGIGQLPAFLAQPLVRSGQLLPLFEDEAPEPWPLYVYRAQRSPVPARVRRVFDSLLAALPGLVAEPPA